MKQNLCKPDRGQQTFAQIELEGSDNQVRNVTNFVYPYSLIVLTEKVYQNAFGKMG